MRKLRLKEIKWLFQGQASGKGHNQNSDLGFTVLKASALSRGPRAVVDDLATVLYRSWLVLAHICSWEPTVYISSQLQVQCHQVGSLKWALVGIFITMEISKYHFFFPLRSQLSNIYHHTTARWLPHFNYTKIQRKAQNRLTKIMVYFKCLYLIE